MLITTLRLPFTLYDEVVVWVPRDVEPVYVTLMITCPLLASIPEKHARTPVSIAPDRFTTPPAGTDTDGKLVAAHTVPASFVAVKLAVDATVPRFAA